ncbi:DUF1127 domain-containing protein [Phyllobacterium leguminum]|uniref:DUF1127 domain-containing protein n=1 Tax=Phyllobacterium leguminum TaxID=314237 RepID=UPI001FE1735C|nr:DUF1127 domain-containing protein [Phyllobacterium leguminum]
MEPKPDNVVQAKPTTIRQWIAWVLHGFAVQRSRRALRNLTDDELKDIGFRPDEAAREAGRPIWDRKTTYDWSR